MTFVKFKNDRLHTRGVFNDFNFFNNDFPAFLKTNSSVPAANVVEAKDNFRLEFALPGINKDQININVEGNLLTVSGKSETKTADETENYTRKEFSYGTFTRTFTLPETVDTNNITADYVDGILKVSIPKKEEAKDKGAKSIKIS